MNRGSDISQDLYRKVFEVVAASQRPLTLQELREAASVLPRETIWDPKRLINDIQKNVNSCGGLLRVDEEHMTVHFAHHSVKQYLLASCIKTNGCGYHVDASIADQALGEICVTYLHFDHLEAQLTQVNTSSSFHAKTLPSAIVHRALPPSVIGGIALRLLKREAQVEFDLPAQLEKVMDLSAGKRDDGQLSQAFLAYAQEYWLFHSRTFSPDTGVYNLWHGLVAGSRSTASLPWDKAGGQTVHLREWAVLNDHRAICQWVIPEICWLPSSSRRETLESLLVKIAGNPPISDSMIFATIFNFALKLKFYGAFPFLHTVADTEALDVFGDKLLSTAAAWGDIRVFDMLVTQGADLNARDRAGRTALYRAVEERQEAIVKLLLARDDVDVNIPDQEQRSPLSLATSLLDDDVLGFVILAPSAPTDFEDLNGSDRVGGTALSRAVEKKAIVKSLLARDDVDVNKPDQELRSPLSLAAGFSDDYVLKLLLARTDLDVQAADSSGQSPIFTAVDRGHVEAVMLMLDHPNSHLSMPWDPSQHKSLLMAAAKKGYTPMVQVLLERHPDTVNWKDGDGLTALALAAMAGRTDVVKLLFERDDVDVHTRDNQGRTLVDLAIQYTYWWGSNGLVDLLERDQRTRRRIIQSTPNVSSPQSEPPWVPADDDNSWSMYESDADAILEGWTDFEGQGIGRASDGKLGSGC
jgi:ankyrin repeat protein